MEISSIENSNLHIQIKKLNICTTHSKTHGKSWDFSIARIHLFQCKVLPPRGSLGAGGHRDSNIWIFGNLRLSSITTLTCGFGGSGELISGSMAEVIVLSQWGCQARQNPHTVVNIMGAQDRFRTRACHKCGWRGTENSSETVVKKLRPIGWWRDHTGQQWVESQRETRATKHWKRWRTATKMNNRIHITVMKLAPGRERWLHTHTGQLDHNELIMPYMESVRQFATFRFDEIELKLYHFRSISLWMFDFLYQPNILTRLPPWGIPRVNHV